MINLRKVIRFYIYHNPNCTKNDIAYELGLYSGYGISQRNHLSWSLIMNDKYIIKTSSSKLILKKSYIPDEIYNVHAQAQYFLQNILVCIIKLLQKTPMGNTEIARSLGIEIYNIDDNGKKSRENLFSWSCMSVLYKQGLIKIYDQNDKKVDPYHKEKGQIMKKYMINISNPIDNLIYQDSIDSKNPDSYGIKMVKKYLDELNIKWEAEYKFFDCIDKNRFPFDIYLPEYNALIEFDGEQHFRVVFFGLMSYNQTVKHDRMKNDYCIKKKKPLLRIPYDQIDNIKQHISEYIGLLKSGKFKNKIILRGRAYD